jgi:hypothetical protein
MRADRKKLTPVDAVGWEKARKRHTHSAFYIKAGGEVQKLARPADRRVCAGELTLCVCGAREFTVGAIPAPHCSKSKQCGSRYTHTLTQS